MSARETCSLLLAVGLQAPYLAGSFSERQVEDNTCAQFMAAEHSCLLLCILSWLYVPWGLLEVVITSQTQQSTTRVERTSHLLELKSRRLLYKAY
jgi:hypothetical protein